MARWAGVYTVDLYKDGAFYASRSMNCGPSTFEAACDQWRRQGYKVEIKSSPKTNGS